MGTKTLRQALLAASLTTIANCAVGQPAADAQQASARTVTVDIPSQPIGQALSALAQQLGLQLLFRAETVDPSLAAPRLSGTYTPQAALKILLADSGLREEWINERTVAIHSGRQGAKITKQPISSLSSGANPIRLAEAPAWRSDLPATRPEERIEEIVVTAQKRSERLQDVPVPVTAMDAQALLEGNRLRLQDYYASVPGLNFSMDNRGAPSMSIRGITTGAFVTPTVGFTVDDVPYGSAVALSSFSPAPDIDPNELARVEVLRGPQGTLYGSNSIGGLIKYVTIDPSTDALSGRIHLGTNLIRHGSDAGYSVSGAINVPLGDTVAVRASAFSRQDPGYIDNVLTAQDDVNETRVEGVRLSGLWQPSDRFELRLSALFQNGEADGASQVQPGLAWQQQYLRDIGGYDRELQAYSANWTARIGSAELTSITGYNIGQTTDSYDITSVLGTLAELFYGVGGTAWIDADNETRNFSQEFRLAMPLSERIDVLLGAFYTDQRTDTDGGFVLIDPETYMHLDQASRQRIAAQYEEYALFANFTVRFTDRFDVQVGGRHSRNEQTYSNVTFGLPPIFSDSVQPPTRSADDTFTYLVTPRLQLSPDVMIYARFASGYRPGGPNVSAPGIPPTFEPDRTQNVEIGAKATFLDGLLSADASIYHIDWRDIQISQGQPVAPFLVYTDNGSRARSRGVELSIAARPLEGMTASLWTVWNDAELTQSLPPNSTFPGGAGDRLPYSTRVSGALSLEQAFPLWSATGVVGASANYVGRRAGEFASPRQSYPSYTRVDLRTGVRSGPWSANFFVNNVTDEQGLLSGGAGVFPFSFTYIQPRTVGLNVSRQF